MTEWEQEEMAERAAEIKYFFHDGSYLVKRAGDRPVPRHINYQAFKIVRDGVVTKDKSTGSPYQSNIDAAVFRELLSETSL